MTLSLIWAQAHDRVIGNEGGMPWHVPEDLAHFRELTSGQTVIMGRKTWDALDPRFKPLPGRRNLVLTRDASWSEPGAEPIHALPAEGWIIGGAELFAATIDHADRLEVTELDIDVPGDTWAPPIGDSWTAPETEWLTSSSGVRYRFRSYTRTG